MSRINVALIGTKFMGRAHSNAWLSVAKFFDVDPQPVMHTVVGRDAADLGAGLDAHVQVFALHPWQFGGHAQHLPFVDHVDARLEARRTEVAKPSLERTPAGKRVMKELLHCAPRFA